MRRSVLESSIQASIELELGAEPDLLLLRNNVGVSIHFREDGSEYRIPYGLGKGSPDLVGLLFRAGSALWFCLEVKAPGEDATDEQKKCHTIWRRFGAFISVVESVEQARAALHRARTT